MKSVGYLIGIVAFAVLIVLWLIKLVTPFGTWLGHLWHAYSKWVMAL